MLLEELNLWLNVRSHDWEPVSEHRFTWASIGGSVE